MSKTEISSTSTTLDGSSVSFGDRLFLSSGLYFGYLYGQVRGDSNPPLLVVDAHPQILSHLRDRENGKVTQDSHLGTLVLQQLRHFERAVVEIATPTDFASSGLSNSLVYGQTVRLKHTFSGMFVTMKSSDGGDPRGSFEDPRMGTPITPKNREMLGDMKAVVELCTDSCNDDASSHSQMFRILPKYSKIRKEGDAVRLGDQVIFQHFESGRVLAAGELGGKKNSVDEVVMHRGGVDEAIGLLAPKREVTFTSAKRKESEIWTLHGFSKKLPTGHAPGPITTPHNVAPTSGIPGDEATVLRAGSVVALHHVESDGFLTVSSNPIPKPNWVGTLPIPLPGWQNHGNESPRETSRKAHCYVESRGEMSPEFSSYSSLWMLEREEPHKGGVVQLHKPKGNNQQNLLYKLRHLASDTYLATEEGGNSATLTTVKLHKDKPGIRETLVRFLPDSSRQIDYGTLNVMAGQTLVRVQFTASKFLLHVRKNRDATLSNRVIYEDLFVIRPLPVETAYQMCKVTTAAAALRICTISNPRARGKRTLDLTLTPRNRTIEADVTQPRNSSTVDLHTIASACCAVLESVKTETQKIIAGSVNHEGEENPVLCRQSLLLDTQMHILCFSLLLWTQEAETIFHDETSPSSSSDSDTPNDPSLGKLQRAKSLCYAILMHLCHQNDSNQKSAARPLLSWLPLVSHLVSIETSRKNGETHSNSGLQLMMTILKGQPEGVSLKPKHLQLCLNNLLPFLNPNSTETAPRVLHDTNRIAVLTCMCISHGTGMKDPQDVICAAVRASRGQLFYSTRCSKEGLQAYIPTGKEKMQKQHTVPCHPRQQEGEYHARPAAEWVDLPRFMLQWGNEAVAYFAASRELMHALAFDNPAGAAYVRRKVSVAEILEGVVLNNTTWQPPWPRGPQIGYPDHQYSDPLKAAYVRLVRAAYIEQSSPKPAALAEPVRSFRGPKSGMGPRRLSVSVTCLDVGGSAGRKEEWTEAPPRHQRRNALAVTGVAAEQTSFPDVQGGPRGAADAEVLRHLLATDPLISRMAGTVLPVVARHLTSIAMLNETLFRAGHSISDNAEGELTQIYLLLTGGAVEVGGGQLMKKAPLLCGREVLCPVPGTSAPKLIASPDVRAFVLSPSEVFSVLRDAHEFHCTSVGRALRAVTPSRVATAISPQITLPTAEYFEGQVVVEEGEVFAKLAIIIHGRIDAVSADGSISELMRGDHVGATEVMRGAPSPVTLLCKTHVSCSIMSHAEMMNALKLPTDNPSETSSPVSSMLNLEEIGMEVSQGFSMDTVSDTDTDDDDDDDDLGTDPMEEDTWPFQRYQLVKGLKSALVAFLEENPVIDRGNCAHTVLQAEWLQLLSSFIELGLYEDDELEVLMPLLAHLLDPDTLLDGESSLVGSDCLFPHPLCNETSPPKILERSRDRQGSLTFGLAQSLGSLRMRHPSIAAMNSGSPSSSMSPIAMMSSTVRTMSPHGRQLSGQDPMTPMAHSVTQVAQGNVRINRAKLEVCRIFMKLFSGGNGVHLALKGGLLSHDRPGLATGASMAMCIGVGLDRSIDTRNTSLVDNLQLILLRVMKCNDHGSRELFVTAFRLYLLISSNKENFPVTHHHTRKGLVKQLQNELRESEDGDATDAEGSFLMKLVEHCKSFSNSSGSALTKGEENETIIAALGCLRDVLRKDGQQASRQALTARQNKLNTLGAMRLVINTVGSCNRRGIQEDVVKEGLELAASLLQGGNHQVQKWLLDYFMSRRDETLFMVLRDRIMKAIAAIDKSVLDAEQRELDGGKVRDDPSSPASPAFAGPLYHIKETMRFLQLCSEGHNSDLQNYFRIQEDNVHSHDLVRESLKFLTSLNSVARVPRAMVMSDFCLECATQTWNTLTEFCQGPVTANQNTLIEGYIGKDVNRAFEINGTQALVQEMRNSAVVTMLSVVEGCTTPFAPLTLRCTLDLQHLLKSIFATDSSERETAAYGYNVFLLMCFLRDYDVYDPSISVHNLLEPALYSDPKEAEVLTFYRQRTAQVEIMRDGWGLERVYFRKPSSCVQLTRRARKLLGEGLSRETQQSRLVDFFDRVEETVFELELVEKIEQGDVMDLRRFVHRWSQRANWVGHILVMLCNSLLLFARSPSSEVEEMPGVVLFVLNVLVVGLSLLLVFGLLEFVWFEGPVIVFMNNKENERSQGKYSVSNYINNREDIASRAKKWDDDHFLVQTVLYKCCMEPRLLRLLLGLVSCFFALTVTPFCMSILLFPVVAESSVIRHVFKAVTKNGKSLLLTMLLGIILMYLFSVVGFVLFRDMFEHEGESHCSTMFRCFVFTVTNGLRAGGGIGELIKAPPWGSDLHAVRVVYDMTFFIFVTVIFMNIVFGIIVDTFGELRQRRELREQEMRLRCFICNVESADFDKRADGFTNHITRDHNMWNYMFFVFYLTSKPKDDLTGQESYVLNCLAKNDLKFIPLNTALALQREAQADIANSPDAAIEGDTAARDDVIDTLTTKIEALEVKFSSQYSVIEEHLSNLTNNMKNRLEKRGGELWDRARDKVKSSAQRVVKKATVKQRRSSLRQVDKPVISGHSVSLPPLTPNTGDLDNEAEVKQVPRPNAKSPIRFAAASPISPMYTPMIPRVGGGSFPSSPATMREEESEAEELDPAIFRDMIAKMEKREHSVVWNAEADTPPQEELNDSSKMRKMHTRQGEHGSSIVDSLGVSGVCASFLVFSPNTFVTVQPHVYRIRQRFVCDSFGCLI